MIYAIVEISGKQFKVSPGQKILVDKIVGENGAKLVYDKVILVNTDGQVEIGQPYVLGKTVEAQIVSQAQGDKIYVKKYKQKVRYRKKIGFRAKLTELLIVNVGGEKFTEAKKETKVKVEKKETTVKKVKKTAEKAAKKAVKTVKKTVKAKK